MNFITLFSFYLSLLYLTNEDLSQIMDDDVVVIAEGTNGTVMKVNEIQVRIEISIQMESFFSCRIMEKHYINYTFKVVIIQLI